LDGRFAQIRGGKMPIVYIDINKGFDKEYKKSILDGIHKALVDSFKIPDNDRNQIIREHEEDLFEKSKDKTNKFIIIEIVAYKGRTREAKRKLYQEIVKNLEKQPGINPNDVLININEPELVNWGVSGGKCADETDLGFKISV
jgi:phenylpyruvate tautomerase PptA (4-oxalocrotonate tautomerase family)